MQLSMVILAKYTYLSHPKGSVAKTSTISLHPPAPPIVRRKSQGETRSSVTDADSTNAKTKADVKTRFQTEPPSDSQIPASPKTQAVGTHIGQSTHAKPKAPVSTVSINGEKQEAIPIQDQSPTNSPPSSRDEAPPRVGIPSPPTKDATPTPIIQNVPQPTTTASPSSTLPTAKDTTSSQTTPTSPSLTTTSSSSLNSVSLLPSDPFSAASVTNDQDSTPHSTTPVTSANIHSTETLPPPLVPYSSLGESQSPALSTSSAVTVAVDPKTVATSITSTITTTVTTTSAAPGSVTISTVSAKTQPSISSTNQAPGILRIPQPPTEAGPSGAKVTSPATDPPHTPLATTTPSKDKDTEANSAADASPKTKGTIQVPGIQLPNDTHQASTNPSITSVTMLDSTVQKNSHQRDQQISPIAVQQPTKISVVSTASDNSGTSVNTPKANTKTAPKVDSKVRTNNNDNSSIIPEGFPPLTHIIPTIIIILAAITLLFQLYKYTPFGFLLGRRRKRKKRDLRTKSVISEESTYESPNIALHEWGDPKLGGKTVENDVYIKLLKINRYKHAIQKKKKKNTKTLIEVHMEVLEEYKNDEWELHKGDFLEICLRGFINEENDNYSKLPNTELTAKSTKNDKTIENIQKQEILWNNWIEGHRNILEQWKKEEWFHILKNKWRNEEQNYKKKNDKLQENILNEQETYSIVSQKEIWKQWISKQATLIDMFNKEDWFKSMVYAQNKEKNNYHINEYNNISVTSKTELKNEKTNEEDRSKNIIQKLIVQIHMMVLEECIKEDIIKQKELCIDNFIEDMHNNNNYDEKRNITQCYTDDFKVLEFEDIQTSINK
ncbi:STP1 protein [Plasmodium ovale wallikeri]|uniref:STP1 protein n=1 Tax=Plasmodium ovale wallikeri TaxID=864142 RepID=A0A1A9AFM3_PLAOA|nr:STP1 protein [Plasmodium ovale wallikeri]